MPNNLNEHVIIDEYVLIPYLVSPLLHAERKMASKLTTKMWQGPLEVLNIRLKVLTFFFFNCHIIPFSAAWAGPATNQHLNAPPLMYASTAGSTPFRFSNHIGDVGHQLVIGPTGAGKSVLLNFMACQFLKYKDGHF